MKDRAAQAHRHEFQNDQYRDAGGRSMKEAKDNTAPKKAEQEHTEDILLELLVFSASLGFIGRLLIDAERVYDSVLIRKIIDHYTGLISQQF